ncbi:NAD-dependent epimerase/dehydratase family protein [Aestuariibacter salexigens]|uniref:NAD-dependent epimerase/dehydratase family protein n=1 Tax=Aestuariibacter salexigens TaxID=226010 RepID=UPI0003F9BBC2|nr:NAD-dependent epimerase/dehydratase family protein [Aestuariibacter salexigens]
MQSSSKFILVGGFGFLGRHLIECLLQNKLFFSVICRSKPSDDWSRFQFFTEGTLTETEIKELAVNHDTLIYMASCSVPATGNVMAEINSNLTTCINIIEKITRYNKKIRVIYLSSGGQIYGNSIQKPVAENHPLKPMSPYGLGKKIIEECLLYLHRTSGLRVLILRVGNPVGKWQMGRSQGLVNVVFECLLKDSVLTIFGDGQEKRDYLDANDVASAIIRVAETDLDFGIWNVGSGIATSTLDIISMIEEQLQRSVKKQFLPRRPIDPQYAVLDCTKIRQEIGWFAQTPLNVFLPKTIEQKKNFNRSI